jgi:hypothetical protein
MNQKVFRSTAKAAAALGARRATVAGENVKPKINKSTASAAGKKLGKSSHK